MSDTRARWHPGGIGRRRLDRGEHAEGEPTREGASQGRGTVERDLTTLEGVVQALVPEVDAVQREGVGRHQQVDLEPRMLPAHRRPLPLQEELGSDTFAAAWSDGRSLSWPAAVAEVLAPPADSDQRATWPVRSQAAPPGLTKRERKILRLLATGESNRAIAERLFISPATVASHVANIFAKLGVDARAKAIAFAHRHDLA